MKKNLQNIDIEIDKLTNSIENVITGDCFKTEIIHISEFDLKEISKKMIKEPINIDFIVDPKPLTKAEEKIISDFIKADKKKRIVRKSSTKTHA